MVQTPPLANSTDQLEWQSFITQESQYFSKLSIQCDHIKVVRSHQLKLKLRKEEAYYDVNLTGYIMLYFHNLQRRTETVE